MYHASPATAAAITAGAVGTFYLLAGLLPRTAALIVGELALGGVAVAACGVLADAGPRGAARALGLARPRARFWLAALLLGASCWYLEGALDGLILGAASETSDEARTLTAYVTDPALPLALLTLVLLPAICEELVFRGVLARGLATRWPPVLAAGVAALVFAAYHLSPLQALPTFLFGCVLGALAARARSIAPGILTHAVNNGLVVLIARSPRTGAWLDQHAAAALGAAAILAITGLAVVAAAPRPA